LQIGELSPKLAHNSHEDVQTLNIQAPESHQTVDKKLLMRQLDKASILSRGNNTLVGTNAAQSQSNVEHNFLIGN